MIRLLALLTVCGLVALTPTVSTVAANASASASVTLSWDPSPSPQTVGYHVYYGTASRNYTSMVDAGAATRTVLAGLMPGMTYYLAVTAYDVSGLESEFSDEIAFTAPSAGANLALNLVNPQTMAASGTGPANAVYEVLATTNFATWSVVGSVTADGSGRFQFTAPVAPQGMRFYRVRQTSP